MDENVLFGEIRKIGEGVARLEGALPGIKDHISAVSAKADSHRSELKDDINEVSKSLDSHEKNLDAHGAGAVQRKDSSVVAWGGLILGIIGLLAACWPLLRK